MRDSAVLRSFVTFDSTFEDDMVVDGEGDITAPSGRTIMDRLRQGLASAGFACTEVELHSSYGWSFEVGDDGEVIWCMLQFADPWLLITEPRRRFVDWIRGRQYGRLHAQVLDAIENVLGSAPQVSRVQRMTEKEFVTAGPSSS